MLFFSLFSLKILDIANSCYETIYEESSNENGIAEFLEIFCSIIHGFSIPVKPQHQKFLCNVLIPLHKVKKLKSFHEQLVHCCVQFVIKAFFFFCFDR